ncbi:hypothetical protein N7526_006148 [Penicillium atrosanguineum]|nr:hypothetical protein N7526_006148 [Penicillium atrosanguineum]
MATDDYGKIADRGSQNYSNWLFKLKRALKSRSVRHWEILIGEHRPEFTSHRPTPRERTIRDHIARENNERVLREHRRQPRTTYLGTSPRTHDTDGDEPATILPNSITEDELLEFVRVHFDEPNKELEEWEALMYTVLDIFISCLDYDPIQHLYGRPTQQTIATKWAKLESTVYKAGHQSAQFIANWQRAYVEVDEALGEESLSIAIQYSMFVRAVGNYPDTIVWLQGVHKFDLKDDRLMENVFADFGTAEDQRYNNIK